MTLRQIRAARMILVPAALVAAILCAPSPTQAGLTLTLSADGVTKFGTVSGNNAAFFNDTVGNFSVFIQGGTTTSPGTPGVPSQINSNQLNVVNNGPVGVADTLLITLTSDGFSSPGSIGTKEFLSSSFVTSNTVQPLTGGNSYSLTSSLTQANGPTITLGPQGLNTSLSTPFTRTSSSFTLSNLTRLTLIGGGSFATGVETTMVSDTQPANSVLATPEPGSLIAAATGLPMLMLAGWYRRRNSTRA